MGFWEPSTTTFKFLNFEITPTLEEFSNLHIFRSLRYVDGGQVELDYLFQRFGRLKDKKSAGRVGTHNRFGNKR
ncbi:hypothetical protein H5410_061375 [Solanum commersonii]|uniref:Uncharacterized protein n=1 Tax=Solanum commersonii TaxID=4109 RepID=A0A9J5W7X3_SOLCO|nr:hypothetical protein H5410_061375 [Solanum commersonii]